MANFICEIEGVRGRNLKLYDTKIVITTKKTAGSLLTGNFTDGEKTIFLCDIVGVQFKKSGMLIGYLQFETPSMQMNNKSDNMFSENTFTYEDGGNGILNRQMENVYRFICDRIEELKYNVSLIENINDVENVRKRLFGVLNARTENNEQVAINRPEVGIKKEEFKNTLCCPQCSENLSFMGYDDNDLSESQICPFCGTKISFNS